MPVVVDFAAQWPPRSKKNRRWGEDVPCGDRVSESYERVPKGRSFGVAERLFDGLALGVCVMQEVVEVVVAVDAAVSRKACS